MTTKIVFIGNPLLLPIIMTETKVGMKGTKALCEVLNVNTTLAALDLSGKQR